MYPLETVTEVRVLGKSCEQRVQGEVPRCLQIWTENISMDSGASNSGDRGSMLGMKFGEEDD